MKLWHIAIFVFVLNLSLNLVVTLNNDFGLGFQEHTSGINSDNGLSVTSINASEVKIQRSVERNQEGIVADALTIVDSVKLAVSGIVIFGQTIIGTAVFTEATIDNITGGTLPFSFVIIIGMVTRLIFIGGIVQLFMGRSFKDME